MSKPTLFFSHSSSDEKLLRKLKEMILEKTGNTFEIFLSSDGQSIPFGRNWIHKIEEKLNDTKAMFVFLSPASIRSQWVYFEAGYVYSKDIRVVPIGMLGVDLTRIGPPLGLLQGFNITNADGLNNIIAIINEMFENSHQESFTDDEYNKLFMGSGVYEQQILGYAATFVNSIQITFLLKVTDTSSDHLKTITESLDRFNIQYHTPNSTVETFGMALSVMLNEINAQLDPSLVQMNFETLDKLLSMDFWDAQRPIKLVIFFNAEVHSVDIPYKRSAKLFGTPISYVKKDTSTTKRQLSFRDIYFDISSNYFRGEQGSAMFYADYFGKRLSEIKLNDLFTILFESGILYIDQEIQ